MLSTRYKRAFAILHASLSIISRQRALSQPIVDHTSGMDRQNDEVTACSQARREQKGIGDAILAPSIAPSNSVVLQGGPCNCPSQSANATSTIAAFPFWD